MKLRRIGFSLLLLGITTIVSAQESDEQHTISRDVVVEREYTPEIQEATKINTLPEVKEEVSEKKKINYSIGTFPSLETKYTLRNIPAAELSKIKKKEKVNNGFVRIGAGYPLNFLGDFYYPLLRSNSYVLGLDLQHRSTWGKNVRFFDKGDWAKATVMRNAARLNFSKSFDTNILYSDVKVTNDYFRYYGKSDIDLSKTYTNENGMQAFSGEEIAGVDKNNFMGVDFEMGLKSKPDYDVLKYDVSVAYNYFGQQTGASEHAFFVKTDFSKEVISDFKVGGELNVNGFFYTYKKNLPFFRAENAQQPNHVHVDVLPYITYTHDIFDLYAGVDFDLGFHKGKFKAYISPKVKFDLSVVRNLFYIYLQAWGGVKENSFRNIATENLYAAPDLRIDDTYNPVNAGAGFKVRILPRLVFDAYVGYRHITNEYYYTNMIAYSATNAYLNTFDVVYDKTQVLDVSASLTYDWSEKLNVSFKGMYHKWMPKTEAFAWYKPQWEAAAEVSYRVIRDLKLSLSYNFIGGRYAKVIDAAEKMRPVHELKLSAMYDITPNVSVFMDLNNMTATQYELWYGAPAMRFNLLAGFVFVF